MTVEYKIKRVGLTYMNSKLTLREGTLYLLTAIQEGMQNFFPIFKTVP